MSEIKAGTRVYNDNGDVGEYVSRLYNGHVVRWILEDPNTGNEYPGCVTEWKNVYLQPLRLKTDPQIAQLQTEKRALQAEIWSLKDEIDRIKKGHDALVKEVTEKSGMERLRDYLDGKFTHVMVVPSYGLPKIMTKEELLEDDDEDRSWRSYKKKEFKLLSLFGNTEGDLLWRVNQYRDGSGSWTSVTLHTSHEDAVEALRALYMKEVEEWRAKPEDKKGWMGKTYDWAAKMPEYITMPDDVKEFYRKESIESLQRDLEEYQKKIEQTQAELAEVQSGTTNR